MIGHQAIGVAPPVEALGRKPGRDQNGADLRVDTQKNSELQRERSASTAAGLRLHGKILRQPAQVLSTLAMGPLITDCFRLGSLKSVPFRLAPFQPPVRLNFLFLSLRFVGSIAQPSLPMRDKCWQGGTGAPYCSKAQSEHLRSVCCSRD